MPRGGALTTRRCILGCAGPTLTDQERAFFREVDPWGFIIFGRNVVDPAQLTALTSDLRECVGRDALVFVDQEGGRVQRMRPPHWIDRPPAAAFGALYALDHAAALEACRLCFELIAADLRAVGITADCAPVLDVPQPGADAIVGDRAYGDTPEVVAALGLAVLEGLRAGGVAGVIKHMPGHGRADADSHLALPRVNASVEDMEAVDLQPFIALKDAPMAMSAHVLYGAWDGELPATTSPRVVQYIIRDRIGFDGLLMTDDLSMKALSGSMSERCDAALVAGCDILLHCNGDMAEMEAVAAAAPALAGRSAERAVDAECFASFADTVDREGGEARLAHLLEPVRGGAAA